MSLKRMLEDLTPLFRSKYCAFADRLVKHINVINAKAGRTGIL